MSNSKSKVVLVTGASSGIGQAIAQTLMEKGFRVYGTSRKAQNTVTKSSNGIGFFKMVQLDVCSDESVKTAIASILQQESRIDILINNAGNGIAGSVEDTTTEEAMYQFDTNFFGVHRMCRAVLPIMREQKEGLIINVSSVAGLFTVPYQAFYSASKYAVEALTETMRTEVKQFGIKVSMVEPPDTKTGFTANRKYVKASADSVYNKNFTKAIKTMEHDEQNGLAPKVIVNAVVRIINSNNPPIRIIGGFQYKFLYFLRRFVPSRFVVYVISKLY